VARIHGPPWLSERYRIDKHVQIVFTLDERSMTTMEVIETVAAPQAARRDLAIARTESPPPPKGAPKSRPPTAPGPATTASLAARVRDAALLEWAAHGGLWM
jgi:hypothetical protein